jgi:hypothetical protein
MRKVVSLCLLLSMVFFVVSFASAGDKSETVNGWVSDSNCGVKGANAGAADCTKKCLEKGAKMVVVTDGDQKILTVDNPEALKGHEGHHVAVSGHVTGDGIHVMSVKML